MQNTEEMRRELWENLFDLMGEVAALECVLLSRRDGEAFSRLPTAARTQYLLRSLHYIEQFTQEIRFLSERMVERGRDV